MNATIPKTMAKDTVTVEQALELIRARQAALPAKKVGKAAERRPRRDPGEEGGPEEEGLGQNVSLRLSLREKVSCGADG